MLSRPAAAWQETVELALQLYTQIVGHDEVVGEEGAGVKDKKRK